MASGDAKPFSIKNTAYRITFPILDADGDLVTGAAGLDSEISKDGGTFADCINEATEIATSSGMYYLDLTATEMNADTVAIIVKTSTSGAKTTPIVMYPVENTDIPVNVKAISDDETAPNNLELMYDGAGYAGGAIKLEIDLNKIGGVAQSATDLKDFADTGYDPSVHRTQAQIKGLDDGLITAAKIAADAITAAKIAADAIGSSEFAQAAADKVWGTAARALTDKTGFALSAANITAIWEKNISAFAGAGYAGTYLKVLYDDWLNGGRLDLLLDAIKTKTDDLPSGLPKNVALNNFEFLMVLSSDHVTPATGKTLTETISKDGEAFIACTNNSAEVGSGVYKISLTQAEMNADVIVLKFTETNCDQRTVTLLTSS